MSMAFFITFDLADRSSAAGYLARDEQDARNALLTQCGLPAEPATPPGLASDLVGR